MYFESVWKIKILNSPFHFSQNQWHHHHLGGAWTWEAYFLLKKHSSVSQQNKYSPPWKENKFHLTETLG